MVAKRWALARKGKAVRCNRSWSCDSIVQTDGTESSIESPCSIPFQCPFLTLNIPISHRACRRGFDEQSGAPFFVRRSIPALPYSIVFLSVDMGRECEQNLMRALSWARRNPQRGLPAACSLHLHERCTGQVGRPDPARCATAGRITFRISLSCDVRMVLENSSRLGKSLDMKPFFFLSAGTESLYIVLSMYLSFDSDHSILGGSSVLHGSERVTRHIGPVRAHCRAPQACGHAPWEDAGLLVRQDAAGELLPDRRCWLLDLALILVKVALRSSDRERETRARTGLAHRAAPRAPPNPARG